MSDWLGSLREHLDNADPDGFVTISTAQFRWLVGAVEAYQAIDEIAEMAAEDDKIEGGGSIRG